MDTIFALPNHHDWADVKFEFPEEMRVTRLKFHKYEDTPKGTVIEIPPYVLDSNQHDLISKHTVWIRSASMHMLSELDKMFHKYPDLSNHVFRIGRLGYKGDPTTRYIIEEVNV